MSAPNEATRQLMLAFFDGKPDQKTQIVFRPTLSRPYEGRLGIEHMDGVPGVEALWILVVEPDEFNLYCDAWAASYVILTLPRALQGMAYARNFILDLARGRTEWIWMLDDSIQWFFLPFGNDQLLWFTEFKEEDISHTRYYPHRSGKSKYNKKGILVMENDEMGTDETLDEQEAPEKAGKGGRAEQYAKSAVGFRQVRISALSVLETLRDTSQRWNATHPKYPIGVVGPRKAFGGPSFVSLFSPRLMCGPRTLQGTRHPLLRKLCSPSEPEGRERARRALS